MGRMLKTLAKMLFRQLLLSTKMIDKK